MLEANHVLLSAVTTGTGTALNLGGQADGFRVYCQWADDVTAGTVIIEEAISPTYAGTWAEIGTFTFVDNAVETLAQATGGVLAVRARVGTTVSGGAAPSVTVRLVAYSGAGA